MKNLFYVTASSVLLAIALNLFLIPHKLILGGISGISMLISYITPFKAGWVILLLNIPIFILGFFQIGKKFIALSSYSVILSTIVMEYIPVKAVSEDIIISSVFGGVLSGIAIAFTIKHGGSTGGLDIIGLILSKKGDYPLGSITMFLNGFVVVISGLVVGWDITLYSMISIYVTSKLLDAIHTKHIKLTCMIVTSKSEEVKEKLLSAVGRGITVLDGEGAYTQEKRKVLFTVISRYQLVDVKEVIKSVDTKAFVNITQTIEVLGSFKRRD